MAKFVYIYSGGSMAETPEEQAAVMQQWNEWFGALGGSLVDGGNPFAGAATVTNASGVTAGGSLHATGYSKVEADSLDDAVAKAKACPVLTGGGTVDVYEALDM